MKYGFDIKISEKDYYEFNNYHMFNSERGKKSLLRSRLLVPAVFLIVLLCYAISGVEWAVLMWSGAVFLVVSLVWFFAVKPLEKLILKLRIASILKKEKRPYASDYTIEFYDDYFVEITSDSRSEIGYGALYKVVVNKGKAIYIYHNALVADLLPFGVFASEDERLEFLDFINSKIKNEKDN